MGNFWEVLFPTQQDFRDAVKRLVPGSAMVGGRQYVWNTLADVAWLSSFGPEGIFVRGLVALDKELGPNVDDWQKAWAGCADWVGQGSAGGQWEWGGKMGALIIPNCYRVSIVATSGTRQVVNVVGVRGSASGLAAGAAAAVKAAWEVAGGPLIRLQPTVLMQWYEATDLSSPTGAIVRLTSTATGGASATTLSTAAASALIKWNGDSRSRSTRGRLYFGPLSEADINTDGRNLVAANQTAISVAFNTFRNSLTTAGFPLVVLSRKLSTAYDVTQHLCEPIIATQRRRIRS